MKGYSHCYAHRSDLADQRRRNASKGGRSGGRGRGGELQELKHEIRRVTASVLAGDLETGPASVGIQGLNCSLRALEIERRSIDMSDLLERLSELEATADRLKGVS